MTSAPKPSRLWPSAALDDLIQADEGAAADEQDVGGVDLEEVLLGVLAAALGRHVRDRALDDLEQRLLHALTRHVARDRGVVALAADLVDLVDVDDAALSPLDVVVGVLQELDDDVLDVLADVPGLGQGGRVRDRERHLEDLGQRLREQRLPAAGRPEQQDVALAELDVVRREPRCRSACSGCSTATARIFFARSCPTTYSSRIDLISAGFGIGSEPADGSSFSTSSAMMSLQSAMHSSQM